MDNYNGGSTYITTFDNWPQAWKLCLCRPLCISLGISVGWRTGTYHFQGRYLNLEKELTSAPLLTLEGEQTLACPIILNFCSSTGHSGALYFLDQFEQFRHITVFMVISAPSILANILTPPQIKQRAHLNLDNSSLNKCPKPSWQVLTPPPRAMPR